MRRRRRNRGSLIRLLLIMMFECMKVVFWVGKEIFRSGQFCNFRFLVSKRVDDVRKERAIVSIHINILPQRSKEIGIQLDWCSLVVKDAEQIKHNEMQSKTPYFSPSLKFASLSLVFRS